MMCTKKFFRKKVTELKVNKIMVMNLNLMLFQKKRDVVLEKTIN